MIYHYHKKEIVSGGGGGGGRLTNGKFFEQYYFLRLQKPFPKKCGGTYLQPPTPRFLRHCLLWIECGKFGQGMVEGGLFNRHSSLDLLVTRYSLQTYSLFSTIYSLFFTIYLLFSAIYSLLLIHSLLIVCLLIINLLVVKATHCH